MKRFTIFFVAITATLWLHAQDTLQVIDTGTITREQWRDSLFRIDLSQVPTGFLIEYAMSDFDSTKYNGTGGDDDTLRDDGKIFELYSILWHSKVNNNASIRDPDSLLFIGYLDNTFDSLVPITFIYQTYSRIRQTALAENLFSLTADSVGMEDVPGRLVSPYSPYQMFAFAPFRTYINRFGAIPFTMPDELFYVSGTDSIEVDFGDGGGYRWLVKGGNINIYYATEGTKYLTARLVTGGITRLAKCEIVYKRPKAFVSFDYTWTIQTTPVYSSESEYLGLSKMMDEPICDGNVFQMLECYRGLVTRTVVMNGCDESFDKPVIIVDGFDTERINPLFAFRANESINDKIDRYRSSEFVQTLREYGYDLVFVFFSNNNGYIENNAKSLELVINRVNAVKTGSFKSTVIGYSMGGLVARWCLKDMEDRSIDHQVENYFSYDAPHQGANIPLGMQYIFKELIRDFPYLKLTQLGALHKAFNSPAAKQMLVTYGGGGEGFLLPPLYTLDPVRAAFADRLVDKGYPQETNNYGISLGVGNNTTSTRNAGNGEQWTTGNPFGPEDIIFFGHLIGVIANMEAEGYAVAEGNVRSLIAYYRFAGLTVRSFFGIFIPRVTLRTRRIRYVGHNPYDDAPGSFVQTQTQFAIGLDNKRLGALASGTTYTHDGHNFISVASALDLQNQNYGSGNYWQSDNMFYNIDNQIVNPTQIAGNTLSTPSLSPFMAVMTATSECNVIFCNASSYRDENNERVDPFSDFDPDHWNNDHLTDMNWQVSRFILRNMINDFPALCDNGAGFCDKNPYINGPALVCSTGSYTIENYPNNTNYTWSSVNGRFIITSGQGTNAITIAKLYDGVDIIRVQITNACGAFITREFPVSIGVPFAEAVIFSNIEIEQEGFWCTSHNGNMFNIQPYSANTSFEVRLLSYPGMTVLNAPSSGYPPDGDHQFFYHPSPGWYVFEVRPGNSCGTGEWTGFEVEFVDCSIMRARSFTINVSPNPATSDLNVKLEEEKPEVKSLNKNEIVRYILTDIDRGYIAKQWTLKNDQSIQKLNIRDVKKGQYILTVIKGKYKESAKVFIR